jgi:hypothetical protein
MEQMWWSSRPTLFVWLYDGGGQRADDSLSDASRGRHHSHWGGRERQEMAGEDRQDRTGQMGRWDRGQTGQGDRQVKRANMT